MSRVDAYASFITEQKDKPVIIEMAGPGKPGPMSSTEKAAKATAEVEKATQVAARQEKYKKVDHDYNTNYAPLHHKKFADHLYKELTNMGFNKVHDGDRRSTYTKYDEGKQKLHVVTHEKPDTTGPEHSWRRHSNEVKHVTSTGVSHSGINYEPSQRAHYEKFDGKEGSETHESAAREGVTSRIRNNMDYRGIGDRD